MCGIAGGWWRTSPDNLKTRVESSLMRMHNRGPDDKGYNTFYIFWGSCYRTYPPRNYRSIFCGHQPMNQLITAMFWCLMGEIYNYRELRNELKDLGFCFTSDSDTEVLLYNWIHWRETCLTKIIGMFAFVINDQQD